MNVRYKKSACLSNKDKNKLIKQELNKQINDSVPAVYSAVALALFRNWNFDYDMINELFVQSEHIWDELGTETMIEMCEKETGILLKGE